EGKLMKSLAGRILQRFKPQPSAAPPRIPYYPDWSQLLEKNRGLWKTARSRAKDGPRILMATSVGGWVPGGIVESTIAVALTLRGAQVHVLLCDEVLPGCMQGMIPISSTEEYAMHGPQGTLCRPCFGL